MKIYFIKHETDYGPFFSSRAKALDYLKEDSEWWKVWGAGIETDKDAYITVQEVELDDENVRFDG